MKDEAIFAPPFVPNDPARRLTPDQRTARREYFALNSDKIRAIELGGGVPPSFRKPAVKSGRLEA